MPDLLSVIIWGVAALICSIAFFSFSYKDENIGIRAIGIILSIFSVCAFGFMGVLAFDMIAGMWLGGEWNPIFPR